MPLQSSSSRVQILTTGALLAAALMQAGCNGNSTSGTSSYDTTTAGVVASSVASASSSSDDSSGSVVADFTPAKARRSFLEFFEEQAEATTYCAAAAKITGASCTSSAITLTLGTTAGPCTVAATGAQWSGSEVLTFNSGAACTAAVSGGILGMGTNNSATLTSSAGLTRTNAAGTASVTTSSASSGFSSAVSGGTTVTCNSSDCTTGTGRSVAILGLHRVEYVGTSTLYDHSISTTTALTITGTMNAGNKTISAGAIQLQHNLAKYVATATIATPLTFNTTCCFPVSGSVTTVFSNGRTGSETMTFNSTCGSVTVGGSTTTFSHCQ